MFGAIYYLKDIVDAFSEENGYAKNEYILNVDTKEEES